MLTNGGKTWGTEAVDDKSDDSPGFIYLKSYFKTLLWLNCLKTEFTCANPTPVCRQCGFIKLALDFTEQMRSKEWCYFSTRWLFTPKVPLLSRQMCWKVSAEKLRRLAPSTFHTSWLMFKAMCGLSHYSAFCTETSGTSPLSLSKIWMAHYRRVTQEKPAHVAMHTSSFFLSVFHYRAPWT